MNISVYNTCTLLWNNVNYVDANLDAPDNAISGNEPSSEMLPSRSQMPEWAKTGNAKEWRPKWVTRNKCNLDIWYGIFNYFQ